MKKWPLRLTAGLSLVLALAILVVLADYFRSATQDSPFQAQLEEPLRILAPFEAPVHKQAFLQLARDYSALETNPPVEVEFLPQDLYKEELRMRLDQGQLPDLIVCENTMMPALVSLGVFADLTALASTEAYAHLYQNSLLQNTMHDGSQYGFPLTHDPYVLFYNQTVLQQRGAKPPKTWQQLLEVADEVNGLGSYGFGIGALEQEETAGFFMQMVYSTGASVRELDGEDGNRFYELMRRLAAGRLMPPDIINWNQADVVHAFAQGEVIMMAAQLSFAQVLAQDMPDFTVGVAQLPTDKKDVYLIHGKNIGMSTTADAAQAEAFLRYLNRPGVNNQLTNRIGCLPVQVAGRYSPPPDMTGLQGEWLQAFRQWGVAKSSFYSWFNISSAITDGMFVLLSDSTVSAEEVARKMQEEVRFAVLEG